MSRLAKAKRGVLDEPARVYAYGDEGVGKSSLAADAPDPIFLDLEDGSSRLDVARYSFRDEPGGHIPESYDEIVSAIDDLATAEHSYQNLVIDTADSLESLIWRHILERDSGRVGPLNKSGKKLVSIESYGYAKGYTVALDVWRGLLARLDALRLKKRMGIIFIGHALVRTWKNPDGEDYDRWVPRIDPKASGKLRSWSDIVGFCTFEEGGGKLDPDQPRAKGYSTGRRLMKLRRTHAYDAKSRYPLPDEVELRMDGPWQPFAAAIAESKTMSPGSIVQLIHVELARLGDPDLATKVHHAIETKARDNSAVLAKYLVDLKNRDPKEMENAQ